MTRASSAPVAVIGAGIAGLVAARQLLRQGFDVQVFEAGPHIAGMAASHTDDDGFSYDLGAHFVTNRLAAAVGCGHWDVVRRYGEVVRIGDRFVRYPGGLLRDPAYVASAVRARLTARHRPVVSAADWFRREYGQALADEVALPLVAAWSGCPADQLSPAVGDKLPESIAATTWLRAAGRLSHRAVAVGYCREQPSSASVFHVYPRGGVAQLCEAVAGGLGDRVHVDHPVQRIEMHDGRAAAVHVGGRCLEVAAVISTIPVNRLPALAEDAAPLDRFRDFRFRPIRALNLKLDGRGLLPDTLTWTPHGFSFFRLSEATWSMPWLAPAGRTMVLVELNALPGDRAWTLEEGVLVDEVLGELEQLIPDVRRRYLGARNHYLPLAYPVFDLAYEPQRQELETLGTGIDNLVSIGRNGEFAHILMEDSYWRTVAAMSKLGSRLRNHEVGRHEDQPARR